jgi:hypothetical protein
MLGINSLCIVQDMKPQLRQWRCHVTRRIPLTVFFMRISIPQKNPDSVLQRASASLILEKQFSCSPLEPLKLHQKFPAVGRVMAVTRLLYF